MNEMRSIAIIGAGVMGRGIAQVCGNAGFRVWLVDLNEEILLKAFETIRSNLDWLVQHELITNQEAQSALSRIKGSLSIEEAANDSDYIIEAVPEILELKKETFHQLDKVCTDHALLLSNTSSLRITEIAAGTSRPERVAGFHWINPPYIVPIVEVIRGEKTSDSTLGKVKDLALKLGKIPVVCQDVPGFLINRLQMALLGEAISLLEEGVASAEDIDNAFRLGLGIRYPFWGPLKINDLSGNKRTTLALFEYLYKETRSDKFRASPLLRQKVERGEVGLLSGKGWYDYSGESINMIIQERDKLLVKMIKFLKEQGLA